MKLSTLNVAVAGAPSEFRIFRSGVNPTENGYSVLFDNQAARDVMAAYWRHGVDIAIDLEHHSLDPAAASYDPDARGWCKLEVRRDAKGGPELWAVAVTWTADGAARLRERRQRYMSPAFMRDEKSTRVRSIHNVAIVAMPALQNTPALVAASRRIAGKEPIMNVRSAAAVPAVIPPAIADAVAAALAAGITEEDIAATIAALGSTDEAKAVASLSSAERDALLNAARRMGRKTFTPGSALAFRRYSDAQRAARGGSR